MAKTGKVIWFDKRRGYGFICPDDSGEDIFVHYSNISGEGRRILRKNQYVEYEVAIDSRYPAMLRAKNVVVK